VLQLVLGKLSTSWLPELSTKGHILSQILILCWDKPIEEATFEDTFTVKSQFPNLRHEDKCAAQEGSIDRPSDSREAQLNRSKVWKVYARRIWKYVGGKISF